jgi:hypothetical protein
MHRNRKIKHALKINKNQQKLMNLERESRFYSFLSFASILINFNWFLPILSKKELLPSMIYIFCHASESYKVKFPNMYAIRTVPHSIECRRSEYAKYAEILLNLGK